MSSTFGKKKKIIHSNCCFAWHRFCICSSFVFFSFSFCIHISAAFSTFAILLFAISLLHTSQADYDCSAKDDGWYYDPEFCHIYWRCIHGTSEEFECASGTAWDHHENRCNWLDSVDCTRAEKTTEKIPAEDEEEDGEQDLTDGHGEHHQNHDEEEEEPPPPPVVKQKKKSKKKNRKLNSNKRMLDAENKEDSDDRENLIQSYSFSRLCMNLMLVLICLSAMNSHSYSVSLHLDYFIQSFSSSYSSCSRSDRLSNEFFTF